MKRELVRSVKYAKVGVKSDVRKIRKLARLIVCVIRNAIPKSV